MGRVVFRGLILPAWFLLLALQGTVEQCQDACANSAHGCKYFSRYLKDGATKHACMLHSSCSAMVERTVEYGAIDVYALTYGAVPQPGDCELLDASPTTRRSSCPTSNTDLHMIKRPDPCSLQSCCEAKIDQLYTTNPYTGSLELRKEGCHAMLKGSSAARCRGNPAAWTYLAHGNPTSAYRSGCDHWEHCRIGKVREHSRSTPT